MLCLFLYHGVYHITCRVCVCVCACVLAYVCRVACRWTRWWWRTKVRSTRPWESMLSPAVVLSLIPSFRRITNRYFVLILGIHREESSGNDPTWVHWRFIVISELCPPMHVLPSRRLKLRLTLWLALRKHRILNVCITTDLHIAAKLNIIMSKSIISMTFAMSYAQWSAVNERCSYRRKLNKKVLILLED